MKPNKPEFKIEMTEKKCSIKGDKTSILAGLGALVSTLAEDGIEDNEIIEVVALGLSLHKSRECKANNLKELLNLFK